MIDLLLFADQGGVLEGAMKGAVKGAIIGAVVGGLLGLIFVIKRLFQKKGNDNDGDEKPAS
jgi:hypothetical protein